MSLTCCRWFLFPVQFRSSSSSAVASSLVRSVLLSLPSYSSLEPESLHHTNDHGRLRKLLTTNTVATAPQATHSFLPLGSNLLPPLHHQDQPHQNKQLVSSHHKTSPLLLQSSEVLSSTLQLTNLPHQLQPTTRQLKSSWEKLSWLRLRNGMKRG